MSAKKIQGDTQIFRGAASSTLLKQLPTAASSSKMAASSVACRSLAGGILQSNSNGIGQSRCPVYLPSLD